MEKITKGKSYIKFSKSDMDDSELVIEDLFVETTNRKQGIGSELVKQAIELARNQGYKTVGLYAEPTNDDINILDLINFYEKLGFESDGDCDELMTYII